MTPSDPRRPIDEEDRHVPGWRTLLSALWSQTRNFFRHPLLTAIVSLAIFLVALRVINQEMTMHTPHELRQAFDTVGVWALLGAVIAVGAAYTALAYNDRFALSMLGKRLPHARTARASFAAYALANTLGYSWATAGTARLRLYRKWGLLPAEIGALSLITGTAVQVGGLAAAGFGLIISAREIALHGPFNTLIWMVTGLFLIIPAALWLIYANRGPAKVHIAGTDIKRPTGRRAAAHLAATMLDWLCAAGVLYLLLPDHGGWTFPAFVAVYVLAGLLGALSGAPGGLGVFEAAILKLAPVTQDTPGAAVALIVYRLLYTLIPLIVATVILGLDQAAPAARPMARAAKRVQSSLSSRISSRLGVTLGESAREFSPRVLATLVFAAGLVLLASVSTPAVAERFDALRAWNLRAISELSHFAASIVGVLLLIVAAGLWRKVRAAWLAAMILLAVGVAFSLAKGLDWEEATVLTLILLIMLPCRDAFTRRSALRASLLSPRWLAAVAGAVATAGWLALFAYQHVDFRTDLWWDFVRDQDAARSLRALTGASVLTLLIAFWAMFVPMRQRRMARTSPEQLDKARAILAQAKGNRADGNLALLGDKAFVFSQSEQSFVMLRARGNRWIAYGDPIGLQEDRLALINKVRDKADQVEARPIFYAVSRDVVPDFAALGYGVRKIGENAIVELPTFTLTGKSMQNLRTARNKMERENTRFELVPAADTPNLLDEMEKISNAWLASHHSQEKTFSLGKFDRTYLKNFPTALCRDADGKMLAFANIWSTADGQEIAIDLMRYLPDAPNGLMEFLFVEIALWAQAQEYQRFDLAMAPLSGLEDIKGAPFLARLGAILFEEGEEVYGFRGLRRFKDKFNPVWEPLYLCAPPDVLMPAALLDVAALTSGGLRAMLKG